MFELDPRLAADTLSVTEWSLSRVLLMNDARFPWLILVPARASLVELTDLSDAEQQQLLKESMTLSHYLKARFKADKMNVAALGNVVAQLHIHHVARFRHDAAWPAPVWGQGVAVPYEDSTSSALLASLRAELPSL